MLIVSFGDLTEEDLTKYSFEFEKEEIIRFCIDINHNLLGFGSPREDHIKQGEILLSKEQNCFAATTYEECIANTYWKDLIGNGCGQDKLIDCKEGDENYGLEVGCFLGCGYADFYRPTKISLMSFTALTPKLGQVNERILCKKIKEKTDMVGEICTSFVL